ncbi:hypothetical protein W59_08374 [Rhodococcus opacus RKJ300 = JCM 13270]|uniref:Helix-turn-helix domain-containing protein n=1 Tax=Rhodococcus opacus RKJ300 = JCM 13270 TaxID=1165867 RepID=I0WUZ9_RHOOP|nr:hypothetical protein W59_08374 [Rhodococcus opacus RKJ300 = JCM 13270]
MRPLTRADLDNRLAISVPESAPLLGISRSTAWRRANSGDIPTVHFGGTRMVPVKALLRLIEADESEIGGGDR